MTHRGGHPTRILLVSILFAAGALLAACGEEQPPTEDPDTVPAVPEDPYDTTDPPPGVEPDPGAVDEPPPPPPDTPARRAPDDTMAPPPDPDPEEAPPADALRTAEGVVGVTGTDAWSLAILRTDTEGSIGLTGDLEGELRRLSGIRIRVEGRRAATPAGPGLEVTGYRLLEMEGRTPHLGILHRDGEDRWILRPEEGDDLWLSGLPEDRVEEGAKIWVVGPISNGRLGVEGYGIVAPPEDLPDGRPDTGP